MFTLRGNIRFVLGVLVAVAAPSILLSEGVLAPPQALVRLPKLSYSGSATEANSDTFGGSELQLDWRGLRGIVTYPKNQIVI